MQSTQKIYKLKMRYPFGISRSTDTEIPTVLFRLADKGQGEGAPVRYKKQKPENVIRALEKLAGLVTPGNMDDIEGLDQQARDMGVPSAAIAGLNMALWDARGRREGKPVYELLGTKRPTSYTTYTVSLSENETMEKRAREAAHLPLIKVKLGRDEVQDIDAIRRIRKAAPNTALRIDANAGWSLGTALSIIPKLAENGVEYVEQPLAIGNYEDLKVLHEKSPLPIMVDEDAQNLASLDKLRGRCAGINIKLSKCGGITEALRMIEFGRNEGWKVMLGCMVETRIGLAAGAHLAGLIDYIDLDAHMLTTNDPVPPGSQDTFSPELPLPEGPGLGIDFIEL